MTIAHVQIQASNLERATAFYLEILKPLGYKVFMKQDGCFVGLADGFNPDFWMGNAAAREKAPTTSLHIAFQAKSQKKVRQVYEAAMKIGAKDNGPPGIRPEYTSYYYGAYFFDEDGNNVEVCHVVPFWVKVIPYVAVVLGVAALYAVYKMGEHGLLKQFGI